MTHHVMTWGRVQQHGWAQTHTDLAWMASFWLLFVTVDLLCGWVAFRILYVIDQHGPGLPRYLGDRLAKPVILSSPFVVGIGWLAFFAARALL